LAVLKTGVQTVIEYSLGNSGLLPGRQQHPTQRGRERCRAPRSPFRASTGQRGRPRRPPCLVHGFREGPRGEGTKVLVWKREDSGPRRKPSPCCGRTGGTAGS